MIITSKPYLYRLWRLDLRKISEIEPIITRLLLQIFAVFCILSTANPSLDDVFFTLFFIVYLGVFRMFFYTSFLC